MARKNETISTEQRVKAATLQRQALELKLGGADYRTIADKLGYAGPSGAHNAVMSAINKTIKEPAAEVVAIELKRLDKMLLAIWPKVINGDLLAIDRALKIMDRRARYEGLDKPVKINVRAIVSRLSAELGLDPEEAAETLDAVEDFLKAAGRDGGL